MILGLTGGIASGKSTVSKILAGYGLEVVDADKVAKEVSERQEVIEELVETFGKRILRDGIIDRGILREIVFKDKKNIDKINKIIHPKVTEVFEETKNKGTTKEIVVFDIPLLYEAKLEYLCDKVLVVTTSEDVQIKRIMKRDGSLEEVARNIIGSQMKTSKKASLGDYVIDNSLGIEELEESVKKFYEDIKKEFSSIE